MSENGDADDQNKTDETVMHTKINTEVEDHHVTAKSRKIVLTKFTVYVTNHRMYIVGSNVRETVFRIMEIDMDNSIEELVVMEDNVYFKRSEIMDVLNGLEETSEGGLTKKITAVALLGFTKLTKCFYLVAVTKRKTVAVLGSHAVYHIEETEMVPVTHNYKTPDRNSDEARYMQTFMNIDLNKTFYYSDSYDITNTLQTNMMRNKTQSLGLNGTVELTKIFKYNERFVWNNSLLEPVLLSFDRVYDWFQPIIHGFIDQVEISVFETKVYVTLIARRSHHFAGARFFKRGVNEMGNVANEVETEQIVADMLTSSFHDPVGGFYNNPRYSSFVQHRGSIPLSWSQTTAANLRIKPPIEFDMTDPYYTQSALHFDDMFQRYGTPVQILNLIKQREKTPRETKLLDAFTDCVNYLNQFLPKENKLDYVAWDMSRASKSRGQDVIEWLERYSESSVSKTGFFLNGRTLADTQLQQGICRTNCVDCLDRTNTAQFVIGKRALGHQLNALGIIDDKYLEYDSDVTNIITEMFHDHGDTIALQYGGSHLVNTLQTYRKINQWSSHSRDIIESVKRFYSNSMVDAQKQEAMNLFLGNHKYEEGKPKIWELNSDYYLHNTGTRREVNYSPSYTKWFTSNNIANKKDDIMVKWNEKCKTKSKFLILLEKRHLIIEKIDPYNGFFENYWNLKYPIKTLTQLDELFEYNMNSTSNYSASVNKAGLNNTVSIVANGKHPTTAGPGAQPRKRKSELFNIFRFFNDKSKDDQRAPSLARASTDKSSISNTIFGANSIFESYDNNSDYVDFDSKEWFSPFKSRKPHRELQLKVAEGAPKNGVMESSDEILLDGIKENLHAHDELFVKNELNDWKDSAVAFSILQVKLQKDTDLKYDTMTHVGKVTVSSIGSDIPIIDHDKIAKAVIDHNFSTDDKRGLDSSDFGKVKHDLERLYSTLDKQYNMKRALVVPKANLKVYEDSIGLPFKGSYVTELANHSKVQAEDTLSVHDDLPGFDTTVIYQENPIASFRRTQSSATQTNGLIEIRNQWRQRRKERLRDGNRFQLLDAINESMDRTKDEEAVDSTDSATDDDASTELWNAYDRMLKPQISARDLEMYKATCNGLFNLYDTKPSVSLPTKVEKAKRSRAQTMGAIDFKPQKGAAATDSSNSQYIFYKFNKGLKKKLSQYNIRGL